MYYNHAAFYNFKNLQYFHIYIVWYSCLVCYNCWNCLFRPNSLCVFLGNLIVGLCDASLVGPWMSQHVTEREKEWY